MNKSKPKLMLFSEMQKLYPDKWVLVENPVFEGTSPQLLKGIFHYAHKNRKKVFEKANQNTDLKNIAIEYTGGKLEDKNYIFVL
jgi:hypothetical protein